MDCRPSSSYFSQPRYGGAAAGSNGKWKVCKGPLPLDGTELFTTENSVLCWTHAVTYVNIMNLKGLPSASFHCSHQSLESSAFGEWVHGKQWALAVSYTST